MFKMRMNAPQGGSRSLCSFVFVCVCCVHVLTSFTRCLRAWSAHSIFLFLCRTLVVVEVSILICMRACKTHFAVVSKKSVTHGFVGHYVARCVGCFISGIGMYVAGVYVGNMSEPLVLW